MKTFHYTLHLLFASLFLIACSQDAIIEPSSQDDKVMLTMTFSNGNMASRAEGEDINPEFIIKKVNLYLFKDNTGNAIYKISREGSYDTSVPIKESMSVEAMTALFGADYKNATTDLSCYAYAVVNYFEDSETPGKDGLLNNGPTINDLKALSITPNATNKTFTEAQTSFVMDGGNLVKYSKNDNKITGDVQVYRAASKITLSINSIDMSVKDDAGNTWVPYFAKKPTTVNEEETTVSYIPMEVAFHQGVKKALVNVGDNPTRPENSQTYNNGTLNEAVFFSTSERPISNEWKANETNKIYELETVHDAFYTYSSDWGRDSNKDREPYITLIVPWVKKYDKDNNEIQDAQFQSCYYQIPINALVGAGNHQLTDCFERNTHYQINLHLGILGDFDPTSPLEVNASYYAVEWKEQKIDVNIKNYKYLVVDKEKVIVNNDPDCVVNYISSDAVTAEIISITKPDYSGIKAGITTIYPTDKQEDVPANFILTAERGVLKIYHPLDNNINNKSTFDYVPYTIKVKIYHTEASDKFVEEVEFIQYPAVYVQNSLNEGGNRVHKGYNDDESRWNNDGYEDNGWVFVNSQKQNDYDGPNYGASSHWDTVEGFDTSSKNPNMYIVTTTVLDNTLNYILGDSRESATYTYSDIGTGNSEDSNGSTLQKYRPTKTDRDDYLSPKFRISSAYGQLGDNLLNIQNAKKRCATYQEYGYPAGRWRLATRAELEYIALLCQYNALPQSLFGASTYWGATNSYTIDTGEGEIKEAGTDASAYLRCVYDDWYWGGTPLNDKTEFTWGDQLTTEELNNMQNILIP